MSYLDDKIVETLDALCKPITAGRLMHWVMIASPCFRFSWADFVEALNNLQSAGVVLENGSGYRTRDESEIRSELRLKELGL